MRTTVRLNDRLLREVKKYAGESGRTITSILEDALREMLSRKGKRPHSSSVKLKTVSGTGVLPGVNLDKSASLLDLMDR